VDHDPRAGAIAAAPYGAGAEVGGLHRARAHRTAIRRGVAVVEAAAAIVVGSIDDVIDSLRLVIDGDAGGIIIAEPHTRHDEDAVGLVTGDRNRRHIRNGLGVECALGRSWKIGARRRLEEMVALTG